MDSLWTRKELIEALHMRLYSGSDLHCDIMKAIGCVHPEESWAEVTRSKSLSRGDWQREDHNGLQTALHSTIWWTELYFLKVCGFKDKIRSM